LDQFGLMVIFRAHNQKWMYNCLTVGFMVDLSIVFIWLVVSIMNFIFHFIYGVSSFPLTNSIIFQDGEIAPPTSIQRFPTMVDPQATMCRHRFLQYGPMYDDIVGGM
jgi:hypothetical protein